MWEKASRGVEMDDIETWIKKECRTPKGPYLRPFTPNPKWRKAEVFVVGSRPATPLRDEFDNFDDYWKALTLRPKRFNEVYSREHKTGESKTTGNRRILTDHRHLKEVTVLVTNVCWVPVKGTKRVSEAELKVGKERLKQLYDHIQPKIIFAYGKPAINASHGIFGHAPDPYLPPKEQGKYPKKPLVLTYRHLSGMGGEKGKPFQPNIDLPEFAQIIREYLGKKV